MVTIPKYIFDSNSGSFIPNPAFDNDQPKVSPNDNVQDVVPDPLTDAIDEIPGGTSNSILLPPNTFSVAEQIVRNNPDGSTSVDVVINVVDDGAARQYEVGITR